MATEYRSTWPEQPNPTHSDIHLFGYTSVYLCTCGRYASSYREHSYGTRPEHTADTCLLPHNPERAKKVLEGQKAAFKTGKLSYDWY